MRRTAVVALCASALFLTACGDDDDVAAPAASEAVGDVTRYCELVQELDDAGTAAFAPLEEDENATDEDYAQAERDFINAHEAEFGELRDVAPAEIRDDVALILLAMEQRASGGEQEETDPATEAAEKNVRTFEKANCS